MIINLDFLCLIYLDLSIEMRLIILLFKEHRQI